MTIELKCDCCGRRQAIVPADKPGGCTLEEAASFGWKTGATGWNIDGRVFEGLCPFCAGRTRPPESDPT